MEHYSARIVVSCPAPYGHGGLGRHLAELVEEARAVGDLAGYFCSEPKASDPLGYRVETPWVRPLVRWTPFRFSPAWTWLLDAAAFDRRVAGRLPAAQALYGFDGMALTAFRAARRKGYAELHLEAAMSHVDHVLARLAQSRRDCPIESSPINGRMARRFRAEYAEADFIWYTSELTRRTFIDAGVPAAKLRSRRLTVPARFNPSIRRPPDDGVFRVVMIGSLTQRKGVHVATRAFRRLAGRAELFLVGGTGTPGMRRFVQQAMRDDPRVRVAPGDPLPWLAIADVCIHPAYEDGFAYAPMEALACGVPVVVSESTGMCEHVLPGTNGYVVPTGDVDALLDRLEHLRRHPLDLRNGLAVAGEARGGDS